MKRIVVLTSGGDAPGMNACIRSIVRTADYMGIEVYGALRGYKGLIDNEFILLSAKSVGNTVQLGGTLLYTSRCPEFETLNGQKQAITNLNKLGAEGVVVIGGDGSFAGARVLEKHFKVACVPGTIDNDLPYTDYTLGFDTAVNTITNLVNNIRDTAISHERPTVIEVMGADCGDIALSVGASVGAEIVLVPEIKTTKQQVVNAIKKCEELGKNSCLIITNEHTYDANELSDYINSKLNVSCRGLVVGHIQRGGSPSAKDRILALNYGAEAVKLLSNNKSGAVGIKQDKYFVTPIETALKTKKAFNEELYNLNRIVGGNVI